MMKSAQPLFGTRARNWSEEYNDKRYRGFSQLIMHLHQIEKKKMVIIFKGDETLEFSGLD